MSIEMMGTELRKNNQSKKTFLKISSEKFWQFKNSPYLCIRFRKESHKEEFFERFRYKQASSTKKAYLGKKTETVNNLNKLEIDLVLEQIKTSIAIWENDIFTMKSLILAQDERQLQA